MLGGLGCGLVSRFAFFVVLPAARFAAVLAPGRVFFLDAEEGFAFDVGFLSRLLALFVAFLVDGFLDAGFLEGARAFFFLGFLALALRVVFLVMAFHLSLTGIVYKGVRKLMKGPLTGKHANARCHRIAHNGR